MRKLQAQKETYTVRFNMEVTEEQYANCTVGCQDRNMTLTVMVPVMTNAVALREGEQLYLEVVPRATTSSKRKVEHWRTDANISKRAAAKGAADEAGKHDRSHGQKKAGCMKVDASAEI